jgi:hypothetical protein
MSTTSQHMGLKIPDGSDPFLRTDFVNNLNIQDQYTGDWICTSTTRPAWGAAQTGMKIIETDTRRTLMWNGTAFKELLYGPAVWWGALRPDAVVNHGTTVSYTLGTFTVNRPGTLVAIASVEYNLTTRGFMGVTSRIRIDGANSGFDTNIAEYLATGWPNNSTFGTGTWSTTVPALGVRNISAGTHSIGIASTGSSSSATGTVKLETARILAIFANATDR